MTTVHGPRPATGPAPGQHYLTAECSYRIDTPVRAAVYLASSLLLTLGCKSPRPDGAEPPSPASSAATVATGSNEVSTRASSSSRDEQSPHSTAPSTFATTSIGGSPTARAACDRYTVATVVEGSEVWPPWVDTQRCVFLGQDAWRIELHELTKTEEGVHACPKLVHIRTDGSTASRYLPHPMGVAGCRGQDCWASACETFLLEYTSSLDISTIYDWDGDGDSEIALTAWSHLSRGRVVSRVIVVDDSGNTLRHLPSTLSLTIAGVSDIDEDAIPDFLLQFSSGVQNDDFGIVSADTLELAAHALPNGKVSVTDAQSKRYAAKRCPEVQLPTIADEVSLLCAKLRGTPRDVAIQAFRANCSDDRNLGCSTDADSTWDAFHPPFTL